MPTLTYTVTQEHIDQGCEKRQHGANNCPHYYASRDAIKTLGWWEGLFAGSKVRLYSDDQGPSTAIASYPDDVYEWINRYDAGLFVEPATFSFEIPEPPR